MFKLHSMPEEVSLYAFYSINFKSFVMCAMQSEVEMLKSEVEYIFGRKVMSSRDCIDLSELIHKKTGLSINSNTLRRFFQLIKSSYPASVGTLNILSIFCGSSSFTEFIVYKQSTTEITKGNRAALLRYLEVMFHNVSITSAETSTFIKLIRTTIDFLNQNLDVAYEFQKVIVKTNSAKRFYFEHFVNIDKLNSFYGNGLRYYLSANIETDAQIFGYALLNYRYWLNMDLSRLKANHEKLMSCKMPPVMPLFVCARYLAARLFYAEAMGLEDSMIIHEANMFYNNAKASNEDYDSLNCFALDFSEALILTKHPTEALMYINEGLERDLVSKQAEDINIHKNFELYQAIVLTKLGDIKKAAEIFDQLSPQNFYFIKKDFYAIFYFSLGATLNKLNPAQESIDLLIRETGFTKMKNFLAVA